MNSRKALAGKTAFITGASAGIGRATAIALAEEGCSVAVCARRPEVLAEVVDQIVGVGGTALATPADVASEKEIRDAVTQAERVLGPIDVVVNNAGVMRLAPMSEGRLDEWIQMVDVNVKGVLHVLAATLPGMAERGGGHVINVGSVAGRRPFPGAAVYSATKFAVRALTWGMHLELGHAHGVRVTDIQPGFVTTDILDEDPVTKAAWADAWQGRRTLEAEDIARTIVFAVTSPDHVSISELLVRPVDQPT